MVCKIKKLSFTYKILYFKYIDLFSMTKKLSESGKIKNNSEVKIIDFVHNVVSIARIRNVIIYIFIRCYFQVYVYLLSILIYIQ